MEREKILASAILRIESALSNRCAIQGKRGSVNDRLFSTLSDIIKETDKLVEAIKKVNQLESDLEGMELAMHCVKVELQAEKDKLEKLQQKFA
jgi:hypothetical protein